MRAQRGGEGRFSFRNAPPQIRFNSSTIASSLMRCKAKFALGLFESVKPRQSSDRYGRPEEFALSSTHNKAETVFHVGTDRINDESPAQSIFPGSTLALNQPDPITDEIVHRLIRDDTQFGNLVG